MANSIPKVYLDSCCFTELACFDNFAKVEDCSRLEDLRYVRALLEAHFDGQLELYTSTLSIAECQYVKDPSDALNVKQYGEAIRQKFRSLLMSGRYVFLVQDTVLVAERAVNLRWVHDLNFMGADAIHVASALEMGCTEFLTFDGMGRQGGIIRQTKALADKFGMRALTPSRSMLVPFDKDPNRMPMLAAMEDPLHANYLNELRTEYLKLVEVIKCGISQNKFPEEGLATSK